MIKKIGGLVKAKKKRKKEGGGTWVGAGGNRERGGEGG